MRNGSFYRYVLSGDLWCCQFVSAPYRCIESKLKIRENRLTSHIVNLKSLVLKVQAILLRLARRMSMKTQTSLVSRQCRLRELG